MSLIKTVIICGASIVLYDFCKNNPNNKYVQLVKLHINKSVEQCTFLKRIVK